MCAETREMEEKSYSVRVPLPHDVGERTGEGEVLLKRFGHRGRIKLLTPSPSLSP